MSNIDLLPRADIPVLFNDFKCKADAVWAVVDSLVVTDVSQKEAMALARKTRLTLREIRIAVENKRVELGESHLKEIKKVNGAANAIKEFIQPLEARLLVQEEFAERAEDERILELARRRTAELSAIRPGIFVSELGSMSQQHYDEYLARLLSETNEIEAANRLRVEAERRLAEQREEYRRQTVAAEAKAAADLEALRAEQAEIQRQQQAAREAEGVERRKKQAEADTIAREERRIAQEAIDVLTAKLKEEQAAKLAEAEAARKLALAPDVEKLRAYRQSVKDLPVPQCLAPDAERCLTESVYALAQGLRIIDQFCERNTA